MSQNDMIIANASGALVRADINSALQALATKSSGSTAPSTTYAFQSWIDTSVTPNLWKMRNSANTSWITIGDVTQANMGLLSLAGGTLTGAVLHALGTVGAPGLSFTGDGDTGIYSPGANILALVAAGVEYLRVSSSGVSFPGTGAISLPSGTTAQRPGSPVNGMVRYNTDNTTNDQYVNGIWKTVPAVTAYPLAAADIASNAITTAKIADANVTPAKLDTTASSLVARAWAYFSGIAITGSYGRSGTTVSCTVTAHGMSTGMIAHLTFSAGTGGTATAGSYVVTVTGVNTFTVTDAASGTITGSPACVRQLFILNNYNCASIQRNASSAGDFTLNFQSALPSAYYVPVFGMGYSDDSATARSPVGFVNTTNFLMSTTQLRILTKNTSTPTVSGGQVDFAFNSVVIFGS